MKGIERPSTRKVILYCEGCNSSDEHFMTNAQIYDKATRLVWCKVCNKMTNWSLFKAEAKGEKK